MTWMIHRDEIDTQSAHYQRLDALDSLSDSEAATYLEVTAEALAKATLDTLRAQELQVSNGVATIPVRGVLLSRPNRFYTLFGIPHADYQTIIKLVEAADINPDVKSVVLDIDSPGGLTKGMFDALDVLHASSKPLTARVAGMAASAAFMLASQADSIAATSRADMIGSVGVVVDMFVDAESVSITNTDSPNKRPDVTTEAGRAVVRTTLDAIFNLAVDAMARGRNVSTDKVRSDFGRGSILLAAGAIEAGMIDSLADTGGQSPEPRAILGDMAIDVKDLKSAEPEAYQAAVDIGAKAERARVDRLMKAGKEYGAMDLAMEKIASGAPADGEAIFDFTMAAKGKSESDARVAANAGNVTTTAKTESTADAELESGNRIVRGALALNGLTPSWIPAGA